MAGGARGCGGPMYIFESKLAKFFVAVLVQ